MSTGTLVTASRPTTRMIRARTATAYGFFRDALTIHMPGYPKTGAGVLSAGPCRALQGYVANWARTWQGLLPVEDPILSAPGTHPGVTLPHGSPGKVTPHCEYSESAAAFLGELARRLERLQRWNVLHYQCYCRRSK